jgi:ABC-type polar amino acid transport system ATPase subunit
MSKFYGAFQALDDINLTVGQGEIVVIIGPSGSGKSTLIRCEVGVVFQNFNLYPHLSVLTNSALAPIRVRGMARRGANKRAHLLLEKVGMAQSINARYPEECVTGSSTTALLRILCRAIASSIHRGDEIVVTNCDHEANIGPC